jgi:hypothetical protein
MRTDGQTNRHDEANSRFFAILHTRVKIKTFYNHDSFNVMSNTNAFTALPRVKLLIASNLKVQTQGQRLSKMCAENAAAFSKQLGT